MARCSFCGIEIEKCTGKALVKKDGSLLNFCSMKCEKNLMKLGRDPIRVKWTLHSQKFRGKLKTREELGNVKESTKEEKK